MQGFFQDQLGFYLKIYCKKNFQEHIQHQTILIQIVGWLDLLLYVPSQQLWSLRDGQFT